jgi:hypothetical protein
MKVKFLYHNYLANSQSVDSSGAVLFLCMVRMQKTIIIQVVLIMEAVITSKTWVNFCETTRRNTPEDGHIHSNTVTELKSRQCLLITFFVSFMS